MLPCWSRFLHVRACKPARFSRCALGSPCGCLSVFRTVSLLHRTFGPLRSAVQQWFGVLGFRVLGFRVQALGFKLHSECNYPHPEIQAVISGATSLEQIYTRRPVHQRKLQRTCCAVALVEPGFLAKGFRALGLGLRGFRV